MKAGKAPDILFISAGPDDVGTIVKQFRDAGVDKPIMGGDGYDTPNLVAIAGAGAENVYFTTHSLMDETLGTQNVKDFIGMYKAEYGVAPENAFAGLGFDTVGLIANAIDLAKSADPKAIKEQLSKINGMPGVTGTITFTPGNPIPQKGVSIILVKEGKLTLAQELVPEKVPAP